MASKLIDLFWNHTSTQFKQEYLEPRNLFRHINSIKSDKTKGIYLIACFAKFSEAVEINYRRFPELIENRELFFNDIEARLNEPAFNVPSNIVSFKSFYGEILV